jgi:hypothetical protein
MSPICLSRQTDERSLVPLSAGVVLVAHLNEGTFSHQFPQAHQRSPSQNAVSRKHGPLPLVQTSHCAWDAKTSTKVLQQSRFP